MPRVPPVGRSGRRALDGWGITGKISLAPTGVGGSLAAAPDETRLIVMREEGPLIDLMIARR